MIAEGQIRLVDGTLIACANYPGCASKSEFGGHASYGYCPSKSLFVWGMRLVLIADLKGVPVGYDLVGPKTGQERDSALDLAAAHAGSLLFADKGFWGKEYLDSMRLIDVELITPDKHRLGRRPPSEIAKARTRLVIESVFSNLKRQMRLDHHLAKPVAGLVQRIAQRLLALTLGMLINILSGRPLRALAAYGRRSTHINPLDVDAAPASARPLIRGRLRHFAAGAVREGWPGRRSRVAGARSSCAVRVRFAAPSAAGPRGVGSLTHA